MSPGQAEGLDGHCRSFPTEIAYSVWFCILLYFQENT